MLSKSEMIKNLESELVIKKEEIECLKKKYAKEIESLNQQHAEECNQLRAVAEEMENILAEVQAELQQVKDDCSRLRSNARDIDILRVYNERLIPPVTPEEVAKAYPDYTIGVTPAFFKLENSTGISWLLERAGYLRQNTGQVANLFNPPNYPDIVENGYFRQALPQDIVSTFEIIFAEQRGDKVFCFRQPITATIIVVSFLVKRTPKLEQWCEQHKAQILVNTGCQQRTDLQQICTILSFPLELPILSICANLDGKDCAETDLEHLRQDYNSQLRNACQRIYLRHFFYGTYPKVRLEDD